MYRVWYSTESFADYIINNTRLKNIINLEKSKLYESDANNPKNFHKVPDHIRKILYLDACDLIVEKDNEPVFSIEVTTEAGTGHNAFQRFARIAASVENQVPAFYIYPEGVIVQREQSIRWDKINPLVFRALESVMSIYNIPALLYYFPSHINDKNAVKNIRTFPNKGLCFDNNITTYSGCPDSKSQSMKDMFLAIDEVINLTEKYGVKESREKLLKNILIRNQRNFMQQEFSSKACGRKEDEMSPLTAVKEIKTEYLLNYLSQYENTSYRIGDLLRSREYTLVYTIDASFRGDPYPGALAAIDYLKCREGVTFEDRRKNLVLLFGVLNVDDINKTISITGKKGASIKKFVDDVKSCSRHNLLTKDYSQLKAQEIPRYFMQVRYGSTYSKNKHIRVFSHFADVVLFRDGSLWRDA